MAILNGSSSGSSGLYAIMSNHSRLVLLPFVDLCLLLPLLLGWFPTRHDIVCHILHLVHHSSWCPGHLVSLEDFPDLCLAKLLSVQEISNF